MKKQVLVKRYTQGLVNSIENEPEYTAISNQLCEFKEMLADQKRLSEILQSSFLPRSKKRDIAEEVLANLSLNEKVLRFILLLVENERIGLLSDILEILPDTWSEEKGISAFEVSFVAPLTDPQKKRLREKLEHLEGRPVFLKYKEDPSLIGGLAVRRKNIIYNVSIKGHLERLQKIISEG